MQVKIWSDVRCPFCYIGKKKFETALEEFPHKDKVEVIWKSFQLDPALKTDPNQTTLDYFVKTKGVSKEQARQMFAGATQMARAEGIEFNLERFERDSLRFLGVAFCLLYLADHTVVHS